jgi:membrane protein
VADDDAAAGGEADSSPTAARLTRRERVRAAIAETRGRLDAKRETSHAVSVAYDAAGRDFEAGGSVLAAAVGFRTFLFFVPYVWFLLLVGGYAADILGRRPDDLFHGRGIASITANGITSTQDLSAGARITALVFVTYALFLGARSFVKVLRIVHTLVWRVAPSRTPHTTRATFVFIAVVTVAIVLSGLIDSLRARLAIGAVVAFVLFIVVVFALWWVVSWWLPHGDCDLLGLVPGAVVFAVGVEALQIFTLVWFPRSMKSKSEIYGTIGSALVLLFWAYLLGRLIAVSAVLNVALWRGRGAQRPGLPGIVTGLPLVGDRLARLWSRLTAGPARAARVDEAPPDG